jgi:hypothetical protein
MVLARRPPRTCFPPDLMVAPLSMGGVYLCRYEVYSVSRPDTPLSTLCYPLLRLYQARFASESGQAVQRIVRGRAAKA